MIYLAFIKNIHHISFKFLFELFFYLAILFFAAYFPAKIFDEIIKKRDSNNSSKKFLIIIEITLFILFVICLYLLVKSNS